jgi:hypothetical protein
MVLILTLNVPTPDLQRPFPTLILKLCTKKELFPFKVGKRVPFHTYFNENNIFLMKLRYSILKSKSEMVFVGQEWEHLMI